MTESSVLGCFCFKNGKAVNKNVFWWEWCMLSAQRSDEFGLQGRIKNENFTQNLVLSLFSSDAM